MITDDDISGFIDGALDPAREAAVARAAEMDPAVAARIAAFEEDRNRLAAAFSPRASAPVPQAWIARIEAAAAPDAAGQVLRPVFGAGRVAAPAPRRYAMWFALAACLALALAGVVDRGMRPQGVLAEANAARARMLAPVRVLAGADLAGSQDVLLRQTTGLAVHVPDLRRQGYALAELDIYAHAAGLRYHDGHGRDLTLYVRSSAGAPRFELINAGGLRTCIWQDEVVSAVMIGEMSAGQMMRVASAAYGALDM